MRLEFATRLFRRLGRNFFGPRLLVPMRVEELPDRLNPEMVYIVGEGEHLWYVAMLCPCRCGETLHMNLMPHSRPRWEVIRNQDGTVTLHPSVWRLTGCGSHFFVRLSQIMWFTPMVRDHEVGSSNRFPRSVLPFGKRR